MSNQIPYEYSDDEQVDDLWLDYRLKFGKFKGQPLRDVVRTKEGRNLIKYYKTWTELRPDAMSAFTACINAYEESKSMLGHAVVDMSR